MKKSYSASTVIPLYFAIEGMFLVVYELATGASVADIVSTFLYTNHFAGVKEFYVMLGIVRAMTAFIGITGVKAKATRRATMIVVGILLVFFSVLGIVYAIASSFLTAPIFIEFIVAFTLSLFYLICAFTMEDVWCWYDKRVKNRPNAGIYYSAGKDETQERNERQLLEAFEETTDCKAHDQ